MTEKIKNYYYVIVPIVLTLALYSISLTFGFRNFDEDTIIKNFYANKTLIEYLEKYFLLDLSGLTKAQGLGFSSIQNVHFCILERPLFYLINFLFQARPFLFHLFSLTLHCLSIYFFTIYIFYLTQNKNLSLFTSLIWAIHPTNIELVIWATSWPNLLGSVIYFYTLQKVIFLLKNNLISNKTWISIFLLTLIQILIIEYSISIPLAIFFSVYVYLKSKTSGHALKKAIEISLPSIITILIYLIIRYFFADNSLQSQSGNIFERFIFLTPQVFTHLLKLVLFPRNLTIDQLDLLRLDDKTGGAYNVFCIVILIAFICLAIATRKLFPYLSLGLILYLIGILPFLQIIPLYSIVAERYNYFGSTFFIFGIVSTLFLLVKNKNLILTFLLILVISFSARTYYRITEWKDSKTLFLSTVNHSKTLLKKGIWTYNLALSQEDNKKREELLELSTNFLKLFITHHNVDKNSNVLKTYELDNKSLLAKAAYRAAINSEILNKKEEQFKSLNLALTYAILNSKIQSQIYKDLGTYYFNNNDFNKAIDYYLKSNLISSSPTINYAIAVCYLKLNDISNYENYLKKAVEVISAYNVAPFKTYGQFLEHNKNDLRNAVHYYKIASLLENKPEPYILLSTALLKQIKIDEAFKYIKRGLYGFPENPSLVYLRGTIFLNKGKIKEGLNDLSSVALREDTPDDIQIEASNILVNIFLNQKNMDEALKYNEIALSLNPKNPEALKYKNILMIR